MAFILVGQVLSIRSWAERPTGKEKERTNHGKDCKEEGWSASPACEEEDGREARR
jgi:hypothetical protein